MSAQQDMLNACASGDVATLQHLFETRNIQKGSKPIYITKPNEPPPTNDLLQAAITNGSLEIVLFLLRTYDSINFGAKVIDALLDRPDLVILEALYDYDKTIVQFEWDSLRTFVTVACMQPPEKITPLLHFLVEHDASLDVGGLPYQFAIYHAIVGNQSSEIIEAMIEKTGPVYYSAMYQAVLRERVDVIEIFMKYGIQGEGDDVQNLQDTAEQEGNANLVEMVNAWTSGWVNEEHEEDKSPTVARRLKQLFQGRK